MSDERIKPVADILLGCACPSPDPYECSRLRYRGQLAQPACECPCHDEWDEEPEGLEEVAP